MLEADFDGELQVDAALVPEIADAQIARQPGRGPRERVDFSRSEFRQHRAANWCGTSRARNAYGQILLGLDRPAADVSRGSNAHDILGVAAIVGVQSIAYNELYP